MVRANMFLIRKVVFDGWTNVRKRKALVSNFHFQRLCSALLRHYNKMAPIVFNILKMVLVLKETDAKDFVGKVEVAAIE